MTRPVTRKTASDLHLRYRATGAGAAVVLLHGSGGAASLGELPDRLARDHHVLVPSHPGFDQAPRPPWFTQIEHIADAYLDLIDRHALTGVTVAGFSLGGWIAAEMAVRDRGRLGRLILVDAIGVQTPGHPILDIFALTPEEALAASYHNPDAFRPALAGATPEQARASAANLAAAELYTRARALHDPGLPARLQRVQMPALVLWGEKEQIVPRESAEAYAASLRGPATLQTIADAGHRSQLEQPRAVERAIRDFLGQE